MNTDSAARLIARLLALRYLPREDFEVRRLLVDTSFRDEVDTWSVPDCLRKKSDPSDLIC